MLTERLTLRVPGATCLGIASVPYRHLAFHKHSTDQSGKCDLPKTDNAGDIAFGVLFEIPDSERSALDRAEGLGHGYIDAPIEVFDAASNPVPAIAYFATDDAINATLVPYDWYHCLVVSGARQHDLPAHYIASIAAVHSVPDPTPTRPTRLEALQALKSANVPFPADA
jgi:hypothetical protein